MGKKIDLTKLESIPPPLTNNFPKCPIHGEQETTLNLCDTHYCLKCLHEFLKKNVKPLEEA